MKDDFKQLDDAWVIQSLKDLEPMIVRLCYKYYKALGGATHEQDRCIDDMLQEARVGAIKALQRYDNTRGTKPTTYAYFYSFAAVKKYCATFFDCMKVPQAEKITISSLRYEGLENLCADEFLSEKYSLYSDSNVEGFVTKQQDIRKEFEKLTPLEYNAILYKTGFSNNKYPESEPLIGFLFDCAKNKLKDNYKSLVS